MHPCINIYGHVCVYTTDILCISANFGHSFDILTYDILFKPHQPTTWLFLRGGRYKKVRILCRSKWSCYISNVKACGGDYWPIRFLLQSTEGAWKGVEHVQKCTEGVQKSMEGAQKSTEGVQKSTEGAWKDCRMRVEGAQKDLFKLYIGVDYLNPKFH